MKSNLYQKDLQIESCTTNEPEAVISKSNEPEAVIRNLFSNFFLHHLPSHTVSLSTVEKIIVVLQAICCTAICWFNPHGFRELLACLYRSLDTQNHRTYCTHAGGPPVGNFWCATVPLLIRTQILQIRNCRAEEDTKGSQDTASRFRLIRLRRSASHSGLQSSDQQPRWL